MSDTGIPRMKKEASRWLDIFSRGLLYAIGLLVLAVCYMYYRELGWDWTSWDLMLISGLLAFILALYLARTIPARMEQTIERLAKRGVFEVTDQALADFQSKFETRARRFAQVGAFVIGLIILISFFMAFKTNIRSRIPLTALEIFLGAVAGYYIGQMVAYGTLGNLTRSERISVVPRHGHIDRAAGLKPIGDFYFFQAMVLAIPCVYIAIWWFIIPILPHYSQWRNPYLGLLAVALIFEILSFFVPMWIFHQIMQAQKTKYLSEADELSKAIVALENRILHSTDPGEISDLQKQLDLQREKYWEIEQMPTWPVDAHTRRKFTVNNLLLFLPFVFDFIRTAQPWKNILNALVEILTTE